MVINDFQFTDHAIKRALDMQIEPHEIRECLLHPWWKRDSSRGDGRLLYYGRRITCVVQSDYVVTIVWRTGEDWKTDIKAGGSYDRRYNEEEWT